MAVPIIDETMPIPSQHHGQDNHRGVQFLEIPDCPSQCDGCDDRTGVRFEQVGTHASYVTYVVTYVVCDHGRVSWIVFRQPCFDLAHQISADIRGFRVYAASNASE